MEERYILGNENAAAGKFRSSDDYNNNMTCSSVIYYMRV